MEEIKEFIIDGINEADISINITIKKPQNIILENELKKFIRARLLEMVGDLLLTRNDLGIMNDIRKVQIEGIEKKKSIANKFLERMW